MMRNDLHIFIDDRLFFGENTHPSSQISAYQSRFSDRAQRHLWGNLCSCMSTVLGLVDGYSYSFRPKEPSSDESIAWDLQSRQTFGSCKAYYFLGTRIPGQYISILNLLSSLISGTGGRKEFAACHLQVDLVDSQYRPIPQLLTDHLAQVVWANCVYPGWEDGDQQLPARLNPLAEDMERTSSGYDERQEGGHTPTASYPKMPPLDLDSDEETGAYCIHRSTNLA